ncbi:hypothetical protein [Brevibacterium sp. CFH 10365]|nr:hypothetical protein [Brevibacterium sp. CFH 10365]
MMFGIIYTLLTGDYPGYALTGIEEDSIIITAMLSLHGLFF